MLILSAWDHMSAFHGGCLQLPKSKGWYARTETTSILRGYEALLHYCLLLESED